MLELFANPGFLVAGGAMVSAPVIIHLINRMRFRRIRWAAMEFLLKSQKRNRRRLIIEQLILLMLRCLLVLLTALLVSRFNMPGEAGFNRAAGFHFVILDDTLSMNDQWKEANNKSTNSFIFAKNSILKDQGACLYTSLAQSTTNENLVILPLSQLVTKPNADLKVFDNLASETTRQEVAAFLSKLKPSQLRVPVSRGIEKARTLFANHAQMRHVLHIYSDFRRVDWTGPESKALYEMIDEMRSEKVKISANDMAHPFRVKDQGGAQRSHDNVAIVDFRPSTRIVGKGTPVTFSITVANFSSSEKKVHVDVYGSDDGKERLDLDFNPQMPLSIPVGGVKTTRFEVREFEGGKGKSGALKLTAKLKAANRTELEDDGLQLDNIRHASVEIREKVPVLVVDWNGERGLKDNKDSFFIEKAIQSVPGGSFQIEYAHKIAGAKPGKVLERTDLDKYPTIFLLNMREFLGEKVKIKRKVKRKEKDADGKDVEKEVEIEEEIEKQIHNLEKYVANGGGVVFFLGPQVDSRHYNKLLYRGGEGVFPVPLAKFYEPPFGQEPIKPKFTGNPQLLLRRDEFTAQDGFPIFGPIFKDEEQPAVLSDLPVNRYWPVVRSKWVRRPGKVFELGTLPNNKPANQYQDAVLNLVKRFPINATNAEHKKHKEFWPGLQRFAASLRTVVEPGQPYEAHQLAGVIRKLLTDSGKKGDKRFPDLEKFWSQAEPNVRALKKDLESLRDSAQFGDPLIVLSKFGKGRVAVITTTAGKDWNGFAGGSLASFIYQPFIWETQNWLSSQGAESNRFVGSKTVMQVDPKQWEGDRRLLVKRTFYRAVPNKKIEVVKKGRDFGTVDDKTGVVTFEFSETTEPGFYFTELFHEGKEDEEPLSVRATVFNVDATREGKLMRISTDEMASASKTEGGAPLQINAPNTGVEQDFVNRQNDLSEWPSFFLIFLIVLVCEQALAVHLSFHLKANEGQLPKQAVPGRAKAA